MSLSVETGAVVVGADSYVSVADCATYAAARGLSFPNSPLAAAEAALRVATAWIDATYRTRFPGSKVSGRSQALEWPRQGATDATGEAVGRDEVPDEIVKATCEAAIRELAHPGTLAPDLERGGKIKSFQAGSVGVVYGDNAEAGTTFTIIDGLLSGLIGGVASGGLFATAVR